MKRFMILLLSLLWIATTYGQYNEVYGDPQPKKKSQKTNLKDEKKNRELDAFLEWGEQIESMNSYNTLIVNIQPDRSTNSKDKFTPRDFTFVYANGKLTILDLKYSIPQDEDGNITKAISMFNEVAVKAMEWSVTCMENEVYDISKVMELSFTHNPDDLFDGVTDGLMATFISGGQCVNGKYKPLFGVYFINLVGGNPMGAIFLSVEDINKVADFLKGVDTKGITEKTSQRNNVYNRLQ